MLWVVDSDGEFARTLPYRTALPRPVVGDAGMVGLGLGPHFERYGAPQARRPICAPGAQATDDGARLGVMDRGRALADRCNRARTQRSVRKRYAEFALDGFKGMR